MAIEVFFGTNRKVRKRNQNQQPIDFRVELNEEKPLLHFGKAKVSDSGEKVEEVNTSRNTSPEKLCCSQEIFNEIKDRMYKGIDTILFFHGFYNTFNDSLIGSAELKHLYEKESEGKYTMIVFSWPSKGELLFSYDRDRDNALASSKVFASGIYQLADFLIELCWLKFDRKKDSDVRENNNLERQNEKRDCGRLHLMAHSMGNYVLRCVLQELRKMTGDHIPRLFDEILLVAADEDKDAFEHKQKLKLLPELAQRVSVYFNREDIPLKISDWFMDNESRVGTDGPKEPYKIPANVSLINCKDVVTGLLEHDYHKTEPAVIRDIVYVLNGWKSEDIPGRVYSSETNSYRLIETEEIDPLTFPDLTT